jgi:vanillate O-demethylase ferredoxin subunit
MLKAFEAATVLRPLDCVHFEYFRPPPPPNTDSAFEVELASTGEVFVVPPGRSILEVLNAAGAYTAGSCTEGVCGACEVKVLAGIPDHRDTVLKPREKELNRKMMICVSRAKSERLVIDVD